MKWTREQKNAIYECGNLLVSAAAGSGKTAVLTERAVRLIKEGAHIEDFLIVTFTRAAAEEMKKRIEKRLHSAAEECPDEADRKRLRSEAAKAPSADISTIHAFCASVLRQSFAEAGLDPAFRVLDDTEAQVLRTEAMDRVIEKNYDIRQKEMLSLVNSFGGEETFITAVEQLYTYIMSRPEPFAWLENAVEKYNISLEGLESSEVVKRMIAESKREIECAVNELRSARDSVENVKIMDTLNDDMMQLRSYLRADGYDAFLTALQSFSPRALRGWERGTPDSEKAFAKAAHDGAKGCVKKMLERRFILPLSQEHERITQAYKQMSLMLEFTREYHEEFSAAKEEAGAIDYSDMEHKTLALLEGETARKLRDKYKYIFIDEYQDSNMVQERITSGIKRDDNLFLVGDVKQSIYRFRQAEPELFIDKYFRFSRGEGGKSIDLNKNFRSADTIIYIVNEIFRRIMNASDAEIEYDERAALVGGRDGCEGSAELCVIETCGESDATDMKDCDEEDADEAPAENSAYTHGKEVAECLCAVERIRDIMKEERIFDEKLGCEREYKYSDFAVLLRQNKTVEKWTSTLTANGIPAYSERSGGYFDAIEVQIFMNLLRVVDNARQDIPLLSVLRSPMFDFTAEELIALRPPRKGMCCIDAVRSMAGEASPFGEKCADFLEKLRRWRKMSALYTTQELMGVMLAETGYYKLLGALPGGEQRQANIDALRGHARNFESSRHKGLNAFITFMDKVHEAASVGEAAVCSADMVKVMTFHKSKGLEFPVVIIGGMNGQFSFINRSASANKTPVLCDDKLGIGVYGLKDSIKAAGLYRRAIEAVSRKKQLAEEMRLLYVALTRTREKLIMIGTVKSVAKELSKYPAGVTSGVINAAKSYMDWVLPCLLETPDSNALRSMLGLDAVIGRERVKTYVRDAKSLDRSREHEASSMIAAWRDEAMKEYDGRYDDVFGMKYPFEAETTLRSKYTVSELVGHGGDPSLAVPPFISEKLGVSPAMIGSAAHKLIQYAPMRSHDRQSVQALLDELTETGRINKSVAEKVSIDKMMRFFDSDIWHRAICADRAYREREFNYRANASKYIGCDGVFMMQGTIDCCFEEDGEWVIIDYKTDYVGGSKTPEQVAARHKAQLDMYTDALEALSGKKVKERYVYLISSGDTVRV